MTVQLLHGGLVALYYGALLALALLGVHRALLALRRDDGPPPPPLADAPHVTVQLPLYNEAAVVERLIDAAAALRWPAGRLQIQVLDDSTDETTDIVARAVQRHRARGVDIEHVRGDRTGFKAGALQRALSHARGELLAIFDADFVPPPDFLEKLCGHFADPTVGLVQARWGHLNEKDGLLTGVQALMLDGHFCVEQWGRASRGVCFNFNGTAGIWRKQAILDGGGWRADTLTEDLDLSYRAQLAGWKFIYRNDVVAPAELPSDMAAFKGQQHRWTKGSAQTAIAMLPSIWRSNLPLRARVHATTHLSGNLAYLLLLLVALLLPAAAPAAVAAGIEETWVADAVLWAMGTGALLIFYGAACRRRGQSVFIALARLPALMALGAGVSLANARGILGAMLGVQSPFVRTPKRGSKDRPRYLARVGWLPMAELGVAAWLALGIGWHVERGLFTTLPVQLLFFVGLAWVGTASVREALQSATVATKSAPHQSADAQDAVAQTSAPSANRHTA